MPIDFLFVSHFFSLSRQRLNQMHREKVEARIRSARSASRTNDEQDLFGEENQIPVGKVSLQILKEDEDRREALPKIDV